MNSRLRHFAPAALLLGFGLLAGYGTSLAKDKPTDITGTWKVTGSNVGEKVAGAKAYTGVVKVTQTHKKGCYALTWIVGAAKTKTLGIGVYDAKGGVLAAAYSLGAGKSGVVLYRIDATGKKAKGVWTMSGALEKSPGFETWERSP